MPSKVSRNIKGRARPAYVTALRLTKFALYRDRGQESYAHPRWHALLDCLYARELGDVPRANLVIRECPIKF